MEESAIWYQYWIDTNLVESQCDKILFVDLLEILFCEFLKWLYLILFYHRLQHVHSRNIVSFKRAKTWFRSTSGENHLNGLYIMNVHCEKMILYKDSTTQNEINMFGMKRRNLQLFTDTD